MNTWPIELNVQKYKVVQFREMNQKVDYHLNGQRVQMSEGQSNLSDFVYESQKVCRQIQQVD